MSPDNQSATHLLVSLVTRWLFDEKRLTWDTLLLHSPRTFCTPPSDWAIFRAFLLLRILEHPSSSAFTMQDPEARMRKQVRALAWPLCWGNSIPQNPHPREPVSVTWLGNRVFAHIVSYDEVILVPFSEGTFGHRHTQRRGHVTTEAGIGVMLPQAKECEGVPAAHRGWERPRDLQREPGPAHAGPCTSGLQN